MNRDGGRAGDRAGVRMAAALADTARWHAHWRVRKFAGATKEPAGLLDVVEFDGNMLLYGGVSCLWQCLIGNGTATDDQTLTYFGAGDAHIGVGDSNTAAAATQTDLQASTNKLRKACDSVTHSDGTGSGAASIVYVATFGTSEANFAWEEFGTFNSDSGNRMLNRKVQALGTKASGTTWEITETISLS